VDRPSAWPQPRLLDRGRAAYELNGLVPQAAAH
jgi:hypothetical protein